VTLLVRGMGGQFADEKPKVSRPPRFDRGEIAYVRRRYRRSVTSVVTAPDRV